MPTKELARTFQSYKENYATHNLVIFNDLISAFLGMTICLHFNYSLFIKETNEKKLCG